MIVQEPPIDIRGLERRFGNDVALGGVDLDVAAGEIHAIVGLNGAGKTTLMRALLGMLRPDAGMVRILGIDPGSADAGIWRRVGHLIESPFAYGELTVIENLTASALLHEVPRSQVAASVTSVIERFDLDRWADHRSRMLSLGNRQRLGLASALVNDPSVLVLDEPSNAMDPGGVLTVREVLTSYAAAGGAVLVSSHHLDQLARVADRITVLHRGIVVGTIDPAGHDLEATFFEIVHESELTEDVQ